MEEMDFSGSASSLFSGSMSPRQSGSVSPHGSGSVSPEPRLLLGHRASPTKMEDSPIQTKRRCMNGDIIAKSDVRPRNLKLETPIHVFDESFDSNVSSPCDSPCSTLRTPKDGKVKYRKDELWAAIESDYQYLMDEEIIDACKSTESDLSWDDDDLSINTKVSFTEFMQQYKELTDWLNQIQLVTQRQSSSRSEKYLNQTYHEEMLQSSPRRKLFNHYAKQLMRRYPNMKEEIMVRLQHLNNLWGAVERAISPAQGYRDEETMLKDLEEDLSGLRRWLHDVESQLLPLCLRSSWTSEELEFKLKEHQVLQRDIESRSKIVSAVLKLCERLQSDQQACSNESEREGLQLVAVNLERRWHAIWLQSLEWQCRLEEAISKKAGLKQATPPQADWTDFQFTTSGSHGRSIHYSDELLHDISDHKGELTDTFDDTECDDGLDSDTSNPDIIPFPAYEYEKIVVDSDTQTDECDSKAAAKFPHNHHHHLHLGDNATAVAQETPCNGFHDGVVEDGLTDKEAVKKGTVTHSTIALSTDKGQTASQTEAEFQSSKKVSMRTSHDVREGMAHNNNATTHFRGKDSHDVGYSSESHSNEEPDNVNSQSPINTVGDVTRRHDNVAVDQSLMEDESQVSPTDNVVLRKKLAAECLSTGGSTTANSGAGNAEQATWRYSMTSAYDSNGSDNEKNAEPIVEVSSGTELDTNKKRYKYKEIIRSPNQKFYTMTTVETDSDAVDKQKQFTSDSSVSHDHVTRKQAAEFSVDTDSSFLDFNESRDTITISNSRTDASTGLEFRFSDLDSSQNEFSAKEESANVMYQRNCNKPYSYEDIENAKNNSLTSCPNGYEDVHCQNGTPTAGQLVNGLGENEVVSPPIASQSVRRLIREAELMVMDEDLFRLQNAKWYQHRKRGKSAKRENTQTQAMVDSITSTDGSLPTEEEAQVSSCDASCEYTTGSESDGEYSTASSDEGEAGDSVILSSQASSRHSYSDDKITSTPRSSDIKELQSVTSPINSDVVLRPKRVAKRRGERPWSVTELYELHNRIDLKPFSISESAINNRSSSMHNLSGSGKIQRTTSEFSSLAIRRLNTLPRRSPKHSRKLKRSASECEQVTNSSGSSHSALNNDSSMMSPSPPRRYTTRERLEHLAQSTNTSSTENKTISCGEQSGSSYYSDRPTARRLNLDDTDASPREATRDASENETSWQGKLPSMSRCLDSEDTDGIINSTIESFSAWDNYLQSPYPSLSDDVPEEKLDDANLNWDTGLEFDDEFQLSQVSPLSVKGGRRSPEKTRPRDRRVSSNKGNHSYHADATIDDSDSDVEDLHHVITESCKSYTVVESALKKYHKDQMETGIDLDYSEYAELIATCETNIKCLQVVNDTLDEEGNAVNVTDDDIQAVDDIIDQWENLLELAIERHNQSRELSAIHKDMNAIKAAIHDVTEQLEVTFEDVKDMEHAIKAIQERKIDMHNTAAQLVNLKKTVTEFSDAYPGVHMTRCQESSANLHDLIHSTEERCTSRMSELQLLLLSWYDLNETQKELTYLLRQEKKQLQCLDVMQGIMDFTYQDTLDTISDLTAMESDLDTYEKKLEGLHKLSQDLQSVCDEKTADDMMKNVEALASELTAIRGSCNAVQDKLGSKISQHKVVERSVPVLDIEGATCMGARSAEEEDEDKTVAEAVMATGSARWLSPPRRQMFLRVLRAAIPIQVLMALLLGAAYLLEPGCCDHMSGFGDYGFSLTPQLRYVNGPPPI